MTDLTALRVQIAALNEVDYQELFVWMGTTEKARRDAAPLVQEAQAELVQDLQDAGKLPAPEAAHVDEQGQVTGSIPAWVDPGTDHAKMYRFGDVVRHKGKVVRSTHRGLNHWEPGTLGLDGRIWEEITEPISVPTAPGEVTVVIPPDSGAAPAFKQPTGGHDAYKVGDRVAYKGVVWESTINANVWAPDAYPQGWKRVP